MSALKIKNWIHKSTWWSPTKPVSVKLKQNFPRMILFDYFKINTNYQNFRTSDSVWKPLENNVLPSYERCNYVFSFK